MSPRPLFSPARVTVLRTLADDGGPVGVRALMHRTGLPRSTVQTVLRRPVACGWVAFTVAPSSRHQVRYLYTITNRGRAWLASLPEKEK